LALRYIEVPLFVNRICFCGGVAESAHHLHLFQTLSKDWGEFQNGMYVEKHIEKIDYIEIIKAIASTT